MGMSKVDSDRQLIHELKARGWGTAALAAQLRIPEDYVKEHLAALEAPLTPPAPGLFPVPDPPPPPAAAPVVRIDTDLPLEGERFSRCPKCELAKPVTEFYQSKSGKPGSYCKDCERERCRKPRQTQSRLVRNRARQRATAALVANHADEFRDLLDTELAWAKAEAEGLAARHAADPWMPPGEAVRLRPGKRPDDAPATEPRVVTTWCGQCREFHLNGHHVPAAEPSAATTTSKEQRTA